MCATELMRPKNSHSIYPGDHAFGCWLSPQGSLSQPEHSTVLEALPWHRRVTCQVCARCAGSQLPLGKSLGWKGQQRRTTIITHAKAHLAHAGIFGGFCAELGPGLDNPCGTLPAQDIPWFSLHSLCHRTSGTVLAPRPGHCPAAALGPVGMSRGLLLSTQHPYMVTEELGPL